jgi:transcription elongation factor Elf1
VISDRATTLCPRCAKPRTHLTTVLQGGAVRETIFCSVCDPIEQLSDRVEAASISDMTIPVLKPFVPKN